MISQIGTVDINSLVTNLLLFVIVAVMGVGLFLRRSPGQVMSRLGLERLTQPQVWIGLAWILFLLVAESITSLLWYVINLEQMELLQELNQEILGGMDSVWAWLILALATGVGEEILFRGALQPVLGLGVTAVLFALTHIQYGLFTPATLLVLFMGLALGILRQRYSTTLTIFIHAGYNFVLGMMVLLATAVT